MTRLFENAPSHPLIHHVVFGEKNTHGGVRLAEPAASAVTLALGRAGRARCLPAPGDGRTQLRAPDRLRQIGRNPQCPAALNILGALVRSRASSNGPRQIPERSGSPAPTRKPSIPGMCASVRTREKGDAFGRRGGARRAPPIRFQATSASCSNASAGPPSMRRLVAFSSTIRTRIPSIDGSGQPAAPGSPCKAEAGREMEAASLPGSLSTRILPSISFTRRAEMVSPRPGATKLARGRTVGLRERFEDQGVISAGMPIPVSRTSNRRRSALRLAIHTDRDRYFSRSVNLMALPTRLTMICRRRVASPTT